MKILRQGYAQFMFYSLLSVAVLGLAGCGGSSSNSNSNNNPTPSTADNTQAVEVNSGPANNYVNGIFTTVTIWTSAEATGPQT